MQYTHFTMKNEGWGIKEDQIPSSSHLLLQTMDSHLQSSILYKTVITYLNLLMLITLARARIFVFYIKTYARHNYYNL